MIKIGNVKIANPLVLGPMAGFTQMPFRQLCKEQGAGLTYTEMISAKAIYYKNRNTASLLKVAPDEGPVSLQLFGREPELLAEIAASLEDGPYDIFDINMGCPVQKVVGNGEGSALMKEPELIGKIVCAMAKRLKKPVTIKIRSGFDEEHINAAEVARIAEDSGACAVAVHARTRTQQYSGKADWRVIEEVKNAVKIPVIGCGDVYTGDDVRRMLRETGCDAVMIARGARGNPWIFAEALSLLGLDSSGIKAEGAPEHRIFQRPSFDEVKMMIERHLNLMIDFCGEYSAVRQMRAHVPFYSLGFPNAAAFRREINRAESALEFRRILSEWNGYSPFSRD